MIIVVLSILVASAVATRDPRCIQYKANSEALTLPHRSDCTKFHICDIQGNALEMRCPANTYFSADDGVCSFDSSACNNAVIIPDVKLLPLPEPENTNTANGEQNRLETVKPSQSSKRSFKLIEILSISGLQKLAIRSYAAIEWKLFFVHSMPA